MEPVIRHSLSRANDSAVLLWALTSAQYPAQPLIRELVATSIVEVVSTFALNARRAMEVLPKDEKFLLTKQRWSWESTVQGEVVQDLWDALNRIIHGQKLKVWFVNPPPRESLFPDAGVAPYLEVTTDRKQSAFIDLMALANAYLFGPYKKIVEAEMEQGRVVH